MTDDRQEESSSRSMPYLSGCAARLICYVINSRSLLRGASFGSNALDAIETIKAAIQRVSTQRSALGAIQNRLEHTINNLDNVVENTTAAESQIRDTDMATEMVKYSNNQILRRPVRQCWPRLTRLIRAYSPCLVD